MIFQVFWWFSGTARVSYIRFFNCFLVFMVCVIFYLLFVSLSSFFFQTGSSRVFFLEYFFLCLSITISPFIPLLYLLFQVNTLFTSCMQLPSMPLIRLECIRPQLFWQISLYQQKLSHVEKSPPWPFSCPILAGRIRSGKFLLYLALRHQ